MGYYINPINGVEKEKWLDTYGEVVQEDVINTFTFAEENPKILPVCLIDNGLFTAAGIAYDKRELEVFLNPEDTRQKQWFLVNLEYLTNSTNGGLMGEELKNFLEALERS
jgi:hypothetical protein